MYVSLREERGAKIPEQRDEQQSTKSNELTKDDDPKTTSLEEPQSQQKKVINVGTDKCEYGDRNCAHHLDDRTLRPIEDSTLRRGLL